MTDHLLGKERLARFLRRAAAGEELTVGFFGGSITQGSLASTEEACYAYRVHAMLCTRFPQAVFHYVNAGIGGTGSHFGVMRIDDDLLCHRPDLVIVDFSVNDMEAVLPLYEAGQTAAKGAADWGRHPASDGGAAETSAEIRIYPETFEAVLRRILSSETAPAALILNNVFYDTGESVEEEHNRIAEHYGVPHVSVRDEILPRIRAGEFAREDVSPDGLHPNDRGHTLVAEAIMRRIDAAMADLATDEAMGGSESDEAMEDVEELCRLDGISTGEFLRGELPAPLTENAYEGAVRTNAANSVPKLRGFVADAKKGRERQDFFRDGWIGHAVGDRLLTELNGGSLAVMYRRTIHRPSPVARLVLDGDGTHPVILDGNFDQDWGDCLFLQPILHHGAPGKHRVEVEIVRAGDEDQTPFYLLAFQEIRDIR